MLPLYKATAFQEYDIAGGSSRPCIVSVIDENNNSIADSYVVKIFKQNFLQHTCREVFGAVLAKHFDLAMPEPVLIEISSTMVQELKKHEKYKSSNICEGVFFGTKFLSNVESFDGSTALKNYDYWELGNIFAFDVLIQNADRQVGKPNVIIKNKTIHVIDHELSLNISKSFEDSFKSNTWDETIKNNRSGHLFRSQLRMLMKKNKLNFDDFTENLRTLKPEILYPYMKQLIDYDYAPQNTDKIVSYLEEIKNNESKFITLLYNLLQ